MNWLKNLFSKPPRPIHVIHLNGVQGFVFSLKDEGKKVTVSGWDDNHWKWNDGDLVQFIRKVTPEGNEGGTYRIDEIRHCGNPDDMYFIDATFVGAQRS